jgi:5-methylcytosine-specific restriction enzyme subunit McrC
LPDLVVAALLRECRTLLRGQLRRDYRPAERVEAVLRGRLDIQRQVSRRFGQVDRLHVRTFERDTSGWENVVCGVALRRAAIVTRPSPLTAESLTLAEAFPHPGAGFDARRALRRATYHRMNVRYRAAHRWAALLLGGGGPTDLLAEGAAEADSLLIDMNRLWELVVTELVRQAVLRSGGKVVTSASRPITVHESDRPVTSLRPDVLARWPADTLPIDAKYKKYDESNVYPGDVHQLLTYARAHCGDGSARAVVVHPSRRGMTARKVVVNGPDGPVAEIAIVGVDASRDPIEAVSHVSQALEAARSRR